MPELRRDLFDVVAHEHKAAWRRPGREAAEIADERLARPEVEAGPGLVEDQQVGVRHQCPGDLDPPLLAGRRVPNAWSCRPPAPIWSRPAGVVAVAGRVGVPPRREGGVPGGDDHVECRQPGSIADSSRRPRSRRAAGDRGHRRRRLPRRGPPPSRSSARDTCSRRERGSSCPIRSGRRRPSAHRRRPTSRSGRGSSAPNAEPRRRSVAGSRG